MVTDIEEINEFVLKWLNKFKDPHTDYIELVDHWMADDWSAFGFEMDCGHAFSEKYGKAVHSSQALEKIINEVTDIWLLGSAIYSQWRYFNHWAYTGKEILEPDNRNWFILALNKLAYLSNESFRLNK